jgi:hypothetical protein
MGHEANYILRRGGRTQIFHSSWGALSLAQDIFWGPDETTRFIRSLQPADALRGPDACGGAALLDWEARRLTWFEAGHIESQPMEQQMYVRLLQQTWPDWEILYAAEEILTIADELGVDRAAVCGGTGQSAEGDKPIQKNRPEREERNLLRWSERNESQEVGADETACLARLVTRLLDEDRWDPQVVLDSIHRASRHASFGCGCLATLVMLPAIAVAAWVRTVPAVVVCVLVAVGVLIPAIRIRRRSASLVAMTEGFQEASLPAGPSLPKKRSILDQALMRLGYPTTDQLEQAGLLDPAADGDGRKDELPDRFGPLRPVRADEIAGVAFYRMRLNKLRFRELRRGATLWQACLLKYLTPLDWSAEAVVPVPRAERLILLNWEDVPRHAQRCMEPWTAEAAESGYATALIYTLPMLGRQEAFSMILGDAEGLILLSLLYARVRVRLVPDDDQYSDEELFEASLLSILPDNRLLVTGTRVSELDPIPAHDVQICEDADWPTLMAVHRRRLESPGRSGLQRVAVADLPALVLQWNQQEIDHRVARGVYQRMSREDIDRFAEEG